MEDLWSKTTAHFQRAVTTAERLAAKDSLKYVTTEHLLLGIVSWRNVAVSMLRSLGTDMPQVSEAVTALQIQDATTSPELLQDGGARELSSDAHHAVVYAREEGFRDGGKYVDEAHLLLGIIRCEATPAGRALAGLGVTADGIRSSLTKLLAGTLKMTYFPEEATEAALETVLGLLKDSNPAVREEAVGQLHRWVNFRACDVKDRTLTGRAALEAEFAMQRQVMQEPRIVDALLAVMEDPNGNVRIKAPLLLGQVKVAAAQESIIRHLRTETHPSIRLMCLLSWGSTGRPILRRR